MDFYPVGLLLISALAHLTTADVIALAVGSDVVVKDVSDDKRTPCGLPTSYVPTGVTFDPQNKLIYWVGLRQSWVGVASLDMGVANLQRKLYTDIISDGNDIDLDMTSGLLYIATKEGLVVMDTNGTESVQLVASGEPQSVAVDPIGRHVYWSDLLTRVIWRADLDGKKPAVFSRVGVEKTSVTIDVFGRRLYWASYDIIYSSSLNGTDIQSARTPSEEEIVKLTVKGDTIYYATSWRVFKVNKWTFLSGTLKSSPPEVVTKANCMELRTLAVYSPEQIKSELSKCSLNNGGCYKLCIPLTDGITCASKREILHVPDKMEATPPQNGSDLDDEVHQLEIAIRFDKESAQLKVVYPIIVIVVVVLTVALIAVIVCYWKKVRNEQGRKLIWDIQSISDSRPGGRDFRLPLEDDMLDALSFDGRSMKSVHA